MEATARLLADVEYFVASEDLQSGQAKGLINLLDNALHSLEKDYTVDACNQLFDFIVRVGAKVPPLTGPLAAELIGSAEAIRGMLACQSSSTTRKTNRHEPPLRAGGGSSCLSAWEE